MYAHPYEYHGQHQLLCPEYPRYNLLTKYWTRILWSFLKKEWMLEKRSRRSEVEEKERERFGASKRQVKLREVEGWVRVVVCQVSRFASIGQLTIVV